MNSQVVIFGGIVNLLPWILRKPSFPSEFLQRSFGTSTQFNSTSSSNAISFDWNFGDMTLGLGANPVHSYTNSGSFNISMIATTANGCRDTINQVVNVYPSPNALFTASPTVQPITNPVFYFINQSTSALTYNWLFGDGTGSPAAYLCRHWQLPCHLMGYQFVWMS